MPGVGQFWRNGRNQRQRDVVFLAVRNKAGLGSLVAPIWRDQCEIIKMGMFAAGQSTMSATGSIEMFLGDDRGRLIELQHISRADRRGYVTEEAFSKQQAFRRSSRPRY